MQIGVSRPTVRAGLRALAAMGVVRSRHGSGTVHSRRSAGARLRAAQLPGRAARVHARGDVRGAAHPRGRRRRSRGRARDAGSARDAGRRGRRPVRVARRSAACSWCTTSTSIAASRRRRATRSSRRSSRWSRRSITSGGGARPHAPVERDLRDAAETHRRIYQAIRARDAEAARQADARASAPGSRLPGPGANRRRAEPQRHRAASGRPDDAPAARRPGVPTDVLIRSDAAARPSSWAAPAASAACSRSGWPTPAPTSSSPAAAPTGSRRWRRRSRRAAGGRSRWPRMSADAGSLERLREACQQELGGVDIMVYAAGVTRRVADAGHGREPTGPHHRHQPDRRLRACQVFGRADGRAPATAASSRSAR